MEGGRGRGLLTVCGERDVGERIIGAGGGADQRGDVLVGRAMSNHIRFATLDKSPSRCNLVYEFTACRRLLISITCACAVAARLFKSSRTLACCAVERVLSKVTVRAS